MRVPRACSAFRARLEQCLAGRAEAPELASLSWHQHLFTCEACRELLEREEALEMLLASLPEPRLPRDLAERVVARLRAAAAPGRAARPAGAAEPAGTARRKGGARAGRSPLDALLELDAAPPAPGDLAARVLASLAAARGQGAPPAAEARSTAGAQAAGAAPSAGVTQPAATTQPAAEARHTGAGQSTGEAQLERWLDAAGGVDVPADLAPRLIAGLRGLRRREAELERLEAWLELAGTVPVPAGLSGRVLAGLEPERGRPLRRATFQRRLTAAAAAAASLLAAASLWLLLPGPERGAPAPPAGEQLARGPLAPRAPGGPTGPAGPARGEPARGRPVPAAPTLRGDRGERPAPATEPRGARPPAGGAVAAGEGAAREGAGATVPDARMLAMLDLLAEDLLWEGGDALDLAASISFAGAEELLLEFGALPLEPDDPDEG